MRKAKGCSLLWTLAGVALAGVAVSTRSVTVAQVGSTVLSRPVNARNDYPNPYRTVEGWMKLPSGRRMGSTSAVDIDKDGESIWVVDRCGMNSLASGGLTVNSCKDSTVAPILKLDRAGNVVKNVGEGLMVLPHGIFSDRDGNVWVTDAGDNGVQPGRGVVPVGPGFGATKGHQVFKFSPDGKLLLTLGRQGGARDPEFFFQPNDVVVAPNGDVFVGQTHDAGTSRILKFDNTGKLVKTWGTAGIGPGEFQHPYALAIDADGRLFVGDRENLRIQIFDQNGNYVTEWKQFGTPSGLYIDSNNTLYVADSESQASDPARNGYNAGVRRGIRVGSAKTGIVTAFIPDPEPCCRPSSASEGVAVDRHGVIYGAQVGLQDVKRYIPE